MGTQIRRWRLHFLLIGLVIVYAACNSDHSENQVPEVDLSNRQRQVSEAALTALRKVQACIEIKSSIRSLDDSLVEAKARLLEASAILPPGELRANLEGAMEDFATASAFISLSSAVRKLDDIQDSGIEEPKFKSAVQKLAQASRLLSIPSK